MRWLMLTALFGLAGLGAAWGEEVSQGNWSGGGGVAGPVTAWGNGFDSAVDASWRAIPGQLALSSSSSRSYEHLIDDDFYQTFGICSADIDGDGDTDVVGAADASSLVGVWFNEGGNPVTWSRQIVDQGFPGGSGVCAADIDGDGWVDIAATATEPGNEIAWWRNGGGDPIEWTKQTIESGWVSGFEVASSDVDQDGDTDVLCTSWTNGMIAWWENGGGAPVTWTRHLLDDQFEGAHCCAAGDIDGDQDRDIVGIAGIDHEVAWWRKESEDPDDWTKVVIRSGYEGGRSVRIADLDFDGALDVVATGFNGQVSWWRNEGGDPISWTEQTIASGFDGGHAVEVADVNGDGRMDVLGAAAIGNELAWWVNGGGDPIDWTMRTLRSDYAAAISVSAGDIDGDGDVDVLGASLTLGEFTWWEDASFVETGQLASSILDSGVDVSLQQIAWEAATPPGTSLQFELRSSDDPDAMGAWSAPITAPGDLTSPLERYVQYRVSMHASDDDRSPVLRRVMLRPAAAAVEPRGDGIPIPRFASPTTGSGHVLLERPSGVDLVLELLDVNGRRVSVHRARGTSRPWASLPSGVYLCRWRMGDHTGTQRVVLVD